jgi:hypothetical protein
MIQSQEPRGDEDLEVNILGIIRFKSRNPSSKAIWILVICLLFLISLLIFLKLEGISLFSLMKSVRRKTL